MSVDRKVAVITGASRGLGESIVKAYRERDYRVVGTSRSITSSNDPDFLAIPGDIADPETGKRVIAAALERFGQVDTLINNAGIFIPGPFEKYTEQNYKDVLATNLNGFFFITQHAIEAMLKQGSGHIVQITTTLVEHANSNVPAVLASITKGGLTAATRGLAIEYASRGIRVNAVAPGMIKTPLHSPETYDAVAALHPLNRMGEPEDIAQAILYLEDATFVTGEIIHVDGGQIAGH
ncbi:SDR family oxidoreductase [Methylobacterium sp. 092160098-2]|uniref:SDR family NAD(P)-dependent oxidoreductase n=1 Tax=Methylobacterium sp. 092160098-2 TaxID=3025129 RepID=UPI002381B25D|nr:SDR family oxidoreductase [Methylobacterium sp. 092160098-2]MDE4915169.1 SDR family oxidoreductase [Methylobacterium sp. 092160098-2]